MWILLLQLGRLMQMWQVLNDADTDESMQSISLALAVGWNADCAEVAAISRDLMGFTYHLDSSCAPIDPLWETGRTSLDVDGMPLAWRIFLLRTSRAGNMTSTELVMPNLQSFLRPNLLGQESWISVDNLLDRSLEYRHRGAGSGYSLVWDGLAVTLTMWMKMEWRLHGVRVAALRSGTTLQAPINFAGT